MYHRGEEAKKKQCLLRVNSVDMHKKPQGEGYLGISISLIGSNTVFLASIRGLL